MHCLAVNARTQQTRLCPVPIEVNLKTSSSGVLIMNQTCTKRFGAIEVIKRNCQDMFAASFKDDLTYSIRYMSWSSRLRLSCNRDLFLKLTLFDVESSKRSVEFFAFSRWRHCRCHRRPMFIRGLPVQEICLIHRASACFRRLQDLLVTI